MRNRLVLQMVVVCLFSASLTLVVGWLSLAASAQTSTQTKRTPKSPQASDLAARIERVENGLLPPAVLKGDSPARMSLADRMKFYKTPGVSIAVINDGRIEWARGYGVLEAGGKEPGDDGDAFSGGLEQQVTHGHGGLAAGRTRQARS